MKNNYKIFVLIFLLTIIGGFLRFYGNTKNPNSLNNDEVSYGYNAYSILKTARDEHGIFMPLSFKSVGDYKNPVLIYSLVPSIAIFGLNEFSIRFTTALVGTISIPFFFLLLLSLLKDKKVALLGTVLLTISAWHIFYSRFASDHLLGLFLLILGMWAFTKMSQGKKIWAFISAFLLTLSMYTYHSNRLFVPLFVLVFLILNFKKGPFRNTQIKFFILTSFILLLPLIHQSLFGAINLRANMVFLSQDIDYTRYVILDHLQRQGEFFQLLFFWIKRYLNYFQPDFLFFNGLNMTTPGILGVGILYLFELPWLILGVAEIIKRKIENKWIIIFWILLGIIPASLTNNEQSAGRSLLILPPLLTVVSLGALNFFMFLNKIKKIYFKIGLIGIYAFFIIITLISSFLIFSVHFPLQKGEAFMEGTKQTVLYALRNKDQYNEIVFDPYRGIETPNIVNVPHLYILFYSAYDPQTYQKENKYYDKKIFHFNKFTVRQIDWRDDRYKKNTLFIGSPWSLKEKDIKKEEILERIYLSSGNLAFLIVSPH